LCRFGYETLSGLLLLDKQSLPQYNSIMVKSLRYILLAFAAIGCAGILFYTIRSVSYNVGDKDHNEFDVIRYIHTDSIERGKGGQLQLKQGALAKSTGSDSAPKGKDVVEPCPT